jgi:putative glutamine amidotransferase
MKKKFIPAIIILAAVLALWVAPPAWSQERFFDTAPAEHQGIRLVVFHPTDGWVKCILALRAEKLLDLDDLTVIGVYHQGERLDLEAARALIRENHVDWFKFHEVQVPIGPGEVFGPNGLKPELERILDGSDGMIFTGGPDIPPQVYAEKTSLLTVIEDPVRHYFELAVLHLLLGGPPEPGPAPLLDSRPGYPVLAICLGAQSLNVATGGTLVQDIWKDIYGRAFVEDILPLGLPDWHNNPYVRLYPNQDLAIGTLQPIASAAPSRLWTVLGLAAGDEPHVLSSHHQAVGRLGRGLRVEATSLDGKVVEALSHERFPRVLAVQFHPENYNLWDSAKVYRLSPADPADQTWRGFLEAHPPSFDFHRKLWAWFAEGLKARR